MPFVLPLAEMMGVGAENAKICALFEVGERRDQATVVGVERICLDGIIRPGPIQIAIPIRGRSPNAGARTLDLLHDLRIAVGAGRRQVDAVLAEVVGIQQIDRSLFALLREQLLSGGKGGQQDESARCDIDVTAIRLPWL